jgi:hypothetical protein
MLVDWLEDSRSSLVKYLRVSILFYVDRAACIAAGEMIPIYLDAIEN